jgi:hypothetical protein
MWINWFVLYDAVKGLGKCVPVWAQATHDIAVPSRCRILVHRQHPDRYLLLLGPPADEGDRKEVPALKHS